MLGSAPRRREGRHPAMLSAAISAIKLSLLYHGNGNKEVM